MPPTKPSRGSAARWQLARADSSGHRRSTRLPPLARRLRAPDLEAVRLLLSETVSAGAKVVREADGGSGAAASAEMPTPLVPLTEQAALFSGWASATLVKCLISPLLGFCDTIVL